MATATAAREGVAWPRLTVLALGAFTTALNVTLLSPLLPAISAEIGVTEATAGQLATVTAASSGATALLVAPWLDRYPRRTWLRLECALLLLGSLLSAAAPSFAWLVAGRMLAGIGGAVIGASALAAVADLEPDPHRRNRAVGFVLTAFTLGSVLGLPLLTQIGAAFGWRWAIVAPAPLALAVVFGSGWLPGAATPAGRPRWGDWVAGYADALRRAGLGWLLAALVTLMAVWFGWLIYFGAYATQLAVDPRGLALLFLIGGTGQVVGSNLAPVALRRTSPRLLGTVAAATLVVGLVVVPAAVAAAGPLALAPFAFLASGAGAVLYACINILLLDAAGTSRGTAMALQSAGLEIGGAIGVAATGLALTLLGGYGAAYAALGGVALLVIACLRRATRPDARADDEEPATTTG